MVSRYERGRSSAMQKILEIAAIFQVDVSFLLGETQNPTSIKDSRQEYIIRSFFPLLTIMPGDIDQLNEKLQITTIGQSMYQPNQAKSNSQLFALKLSEETRLKIEVPTVWLKGFLLCQMLPVDLNAHDTVIAKVKGVTILGRYTKGMEVLAKVIHWQVEL
jgi:transcriptional regulator with XRE-family HTH domain